MDFGMTSAKSILDKPSTQLTEEDISQLTREDCRRYLKEKGMRRPSWNKSQAIQQVLSLKALLETSEDSSAGAFRKILVSKPAETSKSADPAKGPSDNLVSVPVDDIAPCRQNDSPKSGHTRYLDCQSEELDNKAHASRNPGVMDGLVGQMTICYSGKVNVYDGVPPDKIPSDKHVFNPSNAAISQTNQTEKMTEYYQQHGDRGNVTHDQDVEGQANRNMSLQRYLEKKKDRGRFKGRENLGPASSSLEVYLNHHVSTHNSNGQSTRSIPSTPPDHLVLHTSYRSADVQPKIVGFSVDLNEDIQEG